MPLVDIYRTAVGKKALMAVSGIVLLVFVLLHMIGNLKYFQGAEALNHYAHWLREMGAPALPHSGALCIVRVILLVAISIHVLATIQLTVRNWRARPIGYHRLTPQESTPASRTMRWTGVAILLFIVYHLLHLTWGTAHSDFVAGDVHHNLVAGFRIWWVSAIYIAAQIALALHLWHGAWSLFQSLGWNHPRFNRWRNYLAWTLAIVIAGGNILIPVVVMIRK